MKVSDIQTEPLIEVGILWGKEIRFSLPVDYRVIENASEVSSFLPQGRYKALLQGDEIVLSREPISASDATSEPISASVTEASSILVGPCKELCLQALRSEDCFCLEDVCIGIQFHWERREAQSFEGNLKFILNEEGELTAVNQIRLERYLYSVIASEMSAHASLELLKAHAVISRSWLLAQRRATIPSTAVPVEDSTEEHIRWYEREAHRLFDVCADDHCQRYQGINHAHTPQVLEALQQTYGLVLTDGNDICDTRFYKCCGGMTEHFENCWDNRPHRYLTHIRDLAPKMSKLPNLQDFPDLRDEQQAREFILSSPPSFCNTQDKKILSQVLNDYDQETSDFYRWSVQYTVSEISDIVRERSGIDMGNILALEPVERGPSGRIVRLRIVGSKRSLVVGKELEIRKFLSRSHLYSSAFVVDKIYHQDGRLDGFVLHGAGWGHGVGLCQIGAAVMSAQGYSFDSILQHYYPHTSLKVLYKEFKIN